MTISRNVQKEFAQEILPLAELSSDNPEMLKRLHNIAALVLKESGYEDNGLAFALSEYTFELIEQDEEKIESGLIEQAKQSLNSELEV